MRLTTKASYGVRALVDLALMYTSSEPLSIKKISREEGISGIYLEQIFNRLKNRGLIRSVRGPRGGYALAKDPFQVSVYEVVRILEGSIAPSRCVSSKDGDVKVCKRAQKCTPKEVWDEVEKQIRETLEGFSLGDLARRALELDPEKLDKVKNGKESIS